MARATKTQKTALALLNDAIAEADRFIQSKLEEHLSVTERRGIDVYDIKSELSLPRQANTGQEAVREAKRVLVKAQARADLGKLSDVEAAREAVAEAETNTVDQQIRREALIEIKEERLAALEEAHRVLANELTEPIHKMREAAMVVAQDAADKFSIARRVLSGLDTSNHAREIELPYSEAERAFEFPTAIDRAVVVVQSARRTLERG